MPEENEDTILIKPIQELDMKHILIIGLVMLILLATVSMVIGYYLGERHMYYNYANYTDKKCPPVYTQPDLIYKVES